MQLRENTRVYPLSPDGIAAIHVLGNGELGEKSLNLYTKRHVLDRCGFLFPRRNMVVTSDVLAEGLVKAGMSDSWKSTNISGSQRKEAYTLFKEWALQTLWPIIEELFQGRTFYVRSDAPGDSLGRGVYVSEPFINRYAGIADDQRMESFSRCVFNVAMSYFDETAMQFRARFGIMENGINILCCQFIGRPGDLRLGGEPRHALAPFLSAVVKTTLVAGTQDGLIRFEYGLGSGALTGRTIIIHGSAVRTHSGKKRYDGVVAPLQHGAPEVILLPELTVEQIPQENCAVVELLMNSAYPFIRPSVEDHATDMLRLITDNLGVFEEFNDGVPLYLELVSSSFRKNSTQWFVVQASDYSPPQPLSAPPADIDFSSNKDFCGHGMTEGQKRIYIFGKNIFERKNIFSYSAGQQMLEKINIGEGEFITILSQQALTGANLTSMENIHFIRAEAIIEYELLVPGDLPVIYHKTGAPSEHFEQLMLDFERLFIPVKTPFVHGLPFVVAPDEVVEAVGDVALACDKERGIAWGKLRNIELVARYRLE